tara:strand:- start:28729 stop:29478 length:750 start_codon:yes stop_codon:yes gene_type:complete
MKVSPYSQGDANFKDLSRKKAYHIFKDYSFFKGIFSDNEIIFSNSKEMISKYKNKKILVIGGGPSTKELLKGDYETVFNQYDFLWSSNSFFLNSDLKNIKIDLAMMMLEPDLYSKEFVEYSNKFKPTIGFELHDKWKKENFQYDDLFMMQTRFYGIIGVCQRMIIFANILEANQIGFVGLDGLKSMKKGDHSFEKNKKTLPSITNEETFQYQCDELWRYINNNFKKSKIINHGFDNPYHRGLKERLNEK